MKYALRDVNMHFVTLKIYLWDIDFHTKEATYSNGLAFFNSFEVFHDKIRNGQLPAGC